MSRNPTNIKHRVYRRCAIWALRLAALGILVGLWAYAAGPGGVSPLIIPPVSAVYRTFVDLVQSGDVWNAAGVTIAEISVAFGLAALVGVAAGFALARHPLISRISVTLVGWGYIFPLVLFYPLFLLWAGAGVDSKVAYGLTVAVFPIAYNTMSGLRSVDSRYTKVGTAFGASSFAMDRHIKLGAARPMIVAGLRIGMGLTSVSVVLAELLGSNQGLGFMLQAASSRLQVSSTYALIVLLILVTAAFQLLIEFGLRALR